MFSLRIRDLFDLSISIGALRTDAASGVVTLGDNGDVLHGVGLIILGKLDGVDSTGCR